MNGILPNWIERMLGIETGPGEGTVWSIETTWAWPPWVTLLFVVFSIVFVVAVYLREAKTASRPFRLFLAAVRLVLVAMVLMMIAQVSLSLQRTGLPYIAVVVDDSQSMTIDDRYEKKIRKKLTGRVHKVLADQAKLSRWNLATTLLVEKDAAMLKAMADDYKLRVYLLTGARPTRGTRVSEVVQEIKSLEPEGTSTRLGDGVRSVLNDLRGTAPAAVVLLSDGINTAGPPLAEAAVLARRRGVPLYIVGLGTDKPGRDLKLSDLLVDEVVFVDDVMHFEAKLSGTGTKGKEVRIVLREQGKSKVLAEVDVTMGNDGTTQQIRIPYRPRKVGRFKFTVEAEPQEGERNTQNNRQTTLKPIEVRKEKIRVLLVQAYPNFEFRYLRNMLGRDETIDLHTVLQDADLNYAEQDAAALRVFPVRRDVLFDYDVVILGDVNPAMFSGSVLGNLHDFVSERGRGLVMIAGPDYMPGAFRDTPLAKLMPFDLGSVRFPERDQVLTEGFQVEPTRLGMASPPMQLGDTTAETRKIWANLPQLYWLMEASDLKPAVRVLAVDPRRLGHDARPLPVLCLQYVGAGKVLFHATDETWRWRRRVGDVFFARYWVQMIRYLARSKLSGEGSSAALTTDRRNGKYDQGEPVRLRVRFADERAAPAEDDGVVVVLEHRGHKTRRVKLRRAAAGRDTFEAVLSRPGVGDYHAWVALPVMEGRAPSVDFTVKEAGGEFERESMDAATLRQAAETSRGEYYTFETAKRLIKDLPPGRQVPIKSLPPKPIWNTWPVLLLFLLLLVGEWVLRKVGGMV